MFMLRRCPPAPNYQHKILYVGADCALSKTLNAALRPLDCCVIRCPADAGWLARALLASTVRYALLLFDAELIGTTGAELTQFARTKAHRERTPIIILSAGDCAAAKRAGADVCVRMPADGKQLAETIRRLLAAGGRT
jgi:DNA-binding response OmpR family regulator